MSGTAGRTRALICTWCFLCARGARALRLAERLLALGDERSVGGR